MAVCSGCHSVLKIRIINPKRGAWFRTCENCRNRYQKKKKNPKIANCHSCDYTGNMNGLNRHYKTKTHRNTHALLIKAALNLYRSNPALDMFFDLHLYRDSFNAMREVANIPLDLANIIGGYMSIFEEATVNKFGLGLIKKNMKTSN